MANDVAPPIWATAPLCDCIDRLEDINRVLELSIRDLSALSAVPRAIKAFDRWESVTHKARTIPDIEKRLEKATADAEFVEAEGARGFPVLHTHAVIALWGGWPTFAFLSKGGDSIGSGSRNPKTGAW